MDVSRRLAAPIGLAPGAGPSPSTNGSAHQNGSIDQIAVKPGKLPTG